MRSRRSPGEWSETAWVTRTRRRVGSSYRWVGWRPGERHLRRSRRGAPLRSSPRPRLQASASPCPQRSETAARAAASRTTMWITPSSPSAPTGHPRGGVCPTRPGRGTPSTPPSGPAQAGPRRPPRVTNRTPGTARRPLTCDDQILTFGLRGPGCAVRRTGHRIPTSSSYTSVSHPHVVPRSSGLSTSHPQDSPRPVHRCARIRVGEQGRRARGIRPGRAGQESTDHALPVLSPHRLPGHRLAARPTTARRSAGAASARSATGASPRSRRRAST